MAESGALFSFAENPAQVTIRVGVSFVSEEQACNNAESEIGTATFEEILAQSKKLWNEGLSRIEIDVPNTPANVTELLYTSLYRASLTPVNHFPPFLELHLDSISDVLRIKEQCYRRGPRTICRHELVLLRFVVLQVSLFTPLVCEAVADVLVISWDTVR